MKQPDLSVPELLQVPGLIDEAISRTPAAPCGGGFEDWRRDLTGIMCWLLFIQRSDLIETCTRWSESEPLTPAQRSNNASIIKSNAQFVSRLSPDDVEKYASGLLFRTPGLVSDFYKGRAGETYQPSPEEQIQREELREKQRREWDIRQQETLAATADQRKKASEKARSMTSKAAAKGINPRLSAYWVQKEKAAGLPLPVPDGVMCDNVRQFLPVIGQVYWNNAVLVPLFVRAGSELVQVAIETICGTSNPPANRTGEKRGIKHAPRDGAFFPFNYGKGSATVICEGFMSGLALNLMTGGKMSILCAMSCVNFESVLRQLPDSDGPVFIVGDVGEGYKVAKRLHGEKVYAVDLEPVFPEQPGADPFDLLARHGIENGRGLLRSLFRVSRGIRCDDMIQTPAKGYSSRL